MAENDRLPALSGGIGAGVGGGVAAVIDQFFGVSVLVGMPIAAAVGAIVAVGLFLVVRN